MCGRPLRPPPIPHRCGSASAAAHWGRQRRFGLSLAAASAAGFLLGIGDRHMDNMLLDLVRGLPGGTIH